MQFADNGTDCHRHRSEVSHGGGAGYFRTDSGARTVYNFLGCAGSVTVAPGKIFAQWRAFKWNGSTWALCTQGGGVSNMSSGSNVVSWFDLGSGSPPCGNGHYSNMGNSYRHIGSGLAKDCPGSGSQHCVGSVISSGSHDLPA
jgi:hypothetical protein